MKQAHLITLALLSRSPVYALNLPSSLLRREDRVMPGRQRYKEVLLVSVFCLWIMIVSLTPHLTTDDDTKAALDDDSKAALDHDSKTSLDDDDDDDLTKIPIAAMVTGKAGPLGSDWLKSTPDVSSAGTSEELDRLSVLTDALLKAADGYDPGSDCEVKMVCENKATPLSNVRKRRLRQRRLTKTVSPRMTAGVADYALLASLVWAATFAVAVAGVVWCPTRCEPLTMPLLSTRPRRVTSTRPAGARCVKTHHLIWTTQWCVMSSGTVTRLPLRRIRIDLHLRSEPVLIGNVPS
jgi:hypothetical protein